MIGERGSNTTLLHCGTTTDTTTSTTRGNEGRIRPSFIAAVSLKPFPLRLLWNEGRIRPSFIAARARFGLMWLLGVNEGRIRPSFIAAWLPGAGFRPGWRTRVEYDPPSLRPGIQERYQRGKRGTRVEYDPPSLRQRIPVISSWIPTRERGSNTTLLHCGSLRAWDSVGSVRTRVEYDPPSLRRLCRFRPVTGRGNEGRIRPSFIAAASESGCVVEAGGGTRVEYDPPSLRLF